ncbi:MAG: glycosyltransferase family 2 protein, partial [Proteobacteria bacterium]|nr:glycosyltransferase family 2 protein [Pseudomonadota bacterium]
MKRYNLLVNSLPPDYIIHLIIVNDGSSRDLTNELNKIENTLPRTRYFSYSENKGKGHALRTGFAASKSKFVMFTDYDFPYTTESMASLIQLIFSTGSDAVIGIREESYYETLPVRRRKISKILRSLNRIILRLPTNDTQCGLKAFSERGRNVILETKTNRYLIDLEILKLISRKNLKILTHTVYVRDNISASKISNLNLLNEFGSFL